MAEHDSDRDRREDRDDREPEEQHVPFDEDAAWAAIVAGYGEEPPDPPGAKPFKSIEDLALLEADTNDEAGAGADAQSGGAEGERGDRGELPKRPERPQKSAGPDKAGESGGPGEPGKLGDSGESRGSGDSRESEGSGESGESGEDKPVRPVRPLGSSVSFAPGVGPRDYSLPEPSEDDFDTDDEGHFVPPEPPPLPDADPTAKFAWLGVLGGPILLLLAVVFGWEMTWWLTTLGIGGFVGGFATLVMRMKPDDEEDDDPGRGAVV
ncbi:hypothetical protein ACWCPI_04070 [Streptomyces sp. NPDC001920]